MSLFVLLENTVAFSCIVLAGIFGSPLSFCKRNDLIQNKRQYFYGICSDWISLLFLL